MPFAGYANFAECVSKNSGKKNPQAYCATIMRATEATDPSSQKRRQYAKKGVALPDGSYPIPDVAHLKAAIQSIGRAKNPAAAKAHIIKRARALGRTDLLPDDWKGSTKNAKEEELKINGREVIDASEAEFSTDEATGRMFADLVLIKAGRAKNPRNYRPTALRHAVEQKMYDGLRMFVNHSDKPPIKRNFDEMVSAVESTSWDPTIKPLGGIRARAEIFDKEFFEKAQAAKKYIGVSADHQIGITRVREGQRFIEDVHEIIGAKSVDWVLFPSAGGEIVKFATESDEGEDVDYDKITLDDLKANAPKLLDAYKEELAAQENEGPDDEPDDDEGDEKEYVKRSDVTKIVQEQVQAIQTKADTDARKRTDTTKKVREFVGKSGLPTRTQARIVNNFADDLEYSEEAVKEAVEEAQAELKEAGVGKPRISGMGNSGGEETPTIQRKSVRESVEAGFGNPFKKPDPDKEKK